MIRIVPMSDSNLPDATHAALLLWPEHSAAELEEELTALLENKNAAAFLAYSGTLAVGFAQCGLRCDYVEGTHTSPVGYLEGIFVREDFRRQGIASALSGFRKRSSCWFAGSFTASRCCRNAFWTVKPSRNATPGRTTTSASSVRLPQP